MDPAAIGRLTIHFKRENTVIIKSIMKISTIIFLFALLSACTESETEKMVRKTVVIESGESCHLCGMIIANYPGPKGQAYTKTSDEVRKFCSTRDLFSYLLDPEFSLQVKEVYVHDMSKTPWEKPHDDHFIDARKAWYVMGSSQKGAMGTTLASFGLEEDAQAFRAAYGGKVIAFDDIKLSML